MGILLIRNFHKIVPSVGISNLNFGITSFPVRMPKNTECREQGAWTRIEMSVMVLGSFSPHLHCSYPIETNYHFITRKCLKSKKNFKIS